jgi:hypothetical protein
MKVPDCIPLQLFTSSSGLRFVLFVIYFFFCFFFLQQLNNTTNKKSWSNEVNEMVRKGRELVEKVTHTFPNSHDDEQKRRRRRKKERKKKNPPIQLWK